MIYVRKNPRGGWGWRFHFLAHGLYKSATFWIRFPEWNFWNALWIRNRVDAKSRYLLIRWRDKIEPSSLPFLSQIFIEESWVLEWCRIRVGGHIRFEYGHVWTQKFLTREWKRCGFKNIRIRLDVALIGNWELSWLKFPLIQASEALTVFTHFFTLLIPILYINLLLLFLLAVD